MARLRNEEMEEQLVRYKLLSGMSPMVLWAVGSSISFC